MSVRTLDLFCGGGGSSWGARLAGADIVAAVDAWDIAGLTFADNFPDAHVVTSTLHPRSNRKVFGDIGSIDLLLASPECTNHTCARGSREHDEESKRTARFVLNFARAFSPRWIAIENVGQMRGWSGYPDLLSELKKSYKVRVQMLDAACFGVPQRRRRLFIMCDLEREPPPVTGNPKRDQLSVRTFIDPQGTWRTKPLFHKKRAKPTLERARRAISELGEGVPFLIVYYGSDGAGGWQTLDRPLRTMTTLDRFGLVEWQDGAPTLRMLQVPELSRAMGFGPGYRLERGTRRDKIKLLGNAVCPPVMQDIIRTLCGEQLRERATNASAEISPAKTPLLSHPPPTAKDDDLGDRRLRLPA
jgi:DNA (cytosine-5)-methyltransferase 1